MRLEEFDEAGGDASAETSVQQEQGEKAWNQAVRVLEEHFHKPDVQERGYARVSTTDQTCDNQLLEIRRYISARGWTVEREYVDHGISGAKDRRPALDQLVADAKRGRFDCVVAGD